MAMNSVLSHLEPFWAEGKEADFKLDIQEIGAYGCSANILV